MALDAFESCDLSGVLVVVVVGVDADWVFEVEWDGVEERDFGGAMAETGEVHGVVGEVR